MLTIYDEEHAITYLRLLDADAEGADWREVARIVLHIDPEPEPERARRGAISPVPNGWQGMVTGTSFNAAGLVERFATNPAYDQLGRLLIKARSGFGG